MIAERAQGHIDKSGRATAKVPIRKSDGLEATFALKAKHCSQEDFPDPRADRVSLLTLHAAKGLEFSVVFVVGLEDGILPLRWGDDALDAGALAEERRLCYVGMTRAKDRLIVSRAAQRAWRGHVRALDPSPFLRDIESELVTNDERPLTRRPPDDTQLLLL